MDISNMDMTGRDAFFSSGSVPEKITLTHVTLSNNISIIHSYYLFIPHIP